MTPMIDVVFLLLFFFMLATRVGLDDALPLTLGREDAAYQGPPRLVDVLPDGMRLNGVDLAPRALLLELLRLSESGEDIVVVRPAAGVDLQRLVDVLGLMNDAGFRRLAVVGRAP